MKCPSHFCNHENPDGANYCEECGLDLKMSEQQILAWDGLYASFMTMQKEFNDKGLKKMNMSLKEFRSMVERHPEVAFTIGVSVALDKSKKVPEVDMKEVSFPKSGLYSIFLKRLKKLEKHPNKLIKFPVIFQTVCSNFKMTKDEAWDVLFMLNEFGLIELVPFNGVRLNY